MDAFWYELSSLVTQLERHFTTDNVDLAERLVCQCNGALELLRVVYARVDESVHGAGLDVHSGETGVRVLMDLGLVIHCVQFNSRHYADVASTANSAVVRREESPEVCHRGRPPFIISLDQLEGLIGLGLSMTCITAILGVSERTVRRRREMYGLPIGMDRYTSIQDAQLDRLVSGIMQVTPNCGISMVRGALLSRSVMVQRQRIMDSIQRVDPVNQSLRRICRIDTPSQDPTHCGTSTATISSYAGVSSFMEGLMDSQG